jgi:hypothetical protein
MVTPRSQMFLWLAALAITLCLGIAQIVAARQFRLGYLAATACIAVIVGERATKNYLKSRTGSQKESARPRGN